MKTYDDIIDEYMDKTDALVDRKNGKWVIDTPQQDYYFDSFEEMMKDIVISLEEMEKLGV